MRCQLACVGLLAACGGGGDDAPDAMVAPRCNPAATFQAPVPISGLESELDDVAARFSPDERVVVFARRNSGGMFDLYTASRPDADAGFDAPSLLTTVNSVSSEASPALSPDTLLIAFDSDRGTGATRIYTAVRDSAGDPFGPPTVALALAPGEMQPMLANARALYFTSDKRTGAGAHDIWRAEIDRTGATSMPATVPGGVDTAMDEDMPAVTADELHIFFRRIVGSDGILFSASRGAMNDSFGPATAVDNLGMPGSDVAPTWVSPDGCHLYFQSNAAGGAGGYDLYLSVRGS